MCPRVQNHTSTDTYIFSLFQQGNRNRIHIDCKSCRILTRSIRGYNGVNGCDIRCGSRIGCQRIGQSLGRIPPVGSNIFLLIQLNRISLTFGKNTGGTETDSFHLQNNIRRQVNDRISRHTTVFNQIPCRYIIPGSPSVGKVIPFVRIGGITRKISNVRITLVTS